MFILRECLNGGLRKRCANKFAAFGRHRCGAVVTLRDKIVLIGYNCSVRDRLGGLRGAVLGILLGAGCTAGPSIVVAPRLLTTGEQTEVARRVAPAVFRFREQLLRWPAEFVNTVAVRQEGPRRIFGPVCLDAPSESRQPMQMQAPSYDRCMHEAVLVMSAGEDRRTQIEVWTFQREIESCEDRPASPYFLSTSHCHLSEDRTSVDPSAWSTLVAEAVDAVSNAKE